MVARVAVLVAVLAELSQVAPPRLQAMQLEMAEELMEAQVAQQRRLGMQHQEQMAVAVAEAVQMAPVTLERLAMAVAAMIGTARTVQAVALAAVLVPLIILLAVQSAVFMAEQVPVAA